MELPEEEKIFAIGGKDFVLHSFTGRLLETTTRTTQEISGHGGGGGMVVHGPSGGYSNVNLDPVDIETTTKTFKELFLVDERGKERDFELVDFNVRCRAGQVLSVVWAIRKGKDAGHYITVYNHNTEKFSFDDAFFHARLKPRIYPLVFALAGMAVLMVVPLPGEILEFLRYLIVPLIGGLGGGAIGSVFADKTGRRRVEERIREFRDSPFARALTTQSFADAAVPLAAAAKPVPPDVPG